MVQEFELQEIDSIVKEYKRLKNFSLVLTAKDKPMFFYDYVPNNTNEDFDERAWYFEQFSKNIKRLYDNKKCRQLCVVRAYPETTLAQCISMMHLWVDCEGKLNLFVYMRSWNYLKNFDYDCQTFLLLLETFSKMLQFIEGKVEVTCNDLHLQPF